MKHLSSLFLLLLALNFITPAQVYADRERAYADSVKQAANNRLAVEQLKQQLLAQIAQRQLTVRQAWPENFQLLQQDIPEWQELSDIFLEHKFGDSARLQKRIAVLNQLTSDSNNTNNLNTDTKNFINQDYKITPQAKNILQDTGLNSTDYASCYGNQFQQLLHQENLDQLQQLGILSPLSPIFYQKTALANLVDVAREYNHTGLVHNSVTVADLCWAVIDYGKIACQGAVEGIYLAAKDLVDHPDVVLMIMYAEPQYVIAYQLAKVAVNVAKIGITALTDPAKGRADWDDYIAPLNNMLDAISHKQFTLKDATKLSAALAAGWYTQGRLLDGMNQFFITTKTAALQFKAKNPHATPQEYIATSDGQLLKAVDEVARICPASCPIQYKNLKFTLKEQEFTSIIKVTKHGLQRLIERDFTPQEVLSLIKEPHYLKIQSDGAKVFIQNIDNKYKIIIFNETTNELVTALKGVNKKQVLNLAKNHGWTL